MDMWQKCPVCSGTGSFNSDPYSTNAVQMCRTCNGHGIISTINGRPPAGDRIQTITSTTGSVLTITPEEVDDIYKKDFDGI